MEAKIELAKSYQLLQIQLRQIGTILEEHYDGLKTVGNIISRTEKQIFPTTVYASYWRKSY